MSTDLFKIVYMCSADLSTVHVHQLVQLYTCVQQTCPPCMFTNLFNCIHVFSRSVHRPCSLVNIEERQLREEVSKQLCAEKINVKSNGKGTGSVKMAVGGVQDQLRWQRELILFLNNYHIK